MLQLFAPFEITRAERGLRALVRVLFLTRASACSVPNVKERTVELRLDKLPPGAYHYSLDVDGRPVAHHQLLVQ